MYVTPQHYGVDKCSRRVSVLHGLTSPDLSRCARTGAEIYSYPVRKRRLDLTDLIACRQAPGALTEGIK